MTHVEQCIFDFKQRMKATFYFSVAPLGLLAALFSVDGKGDYGDVIRGISIFFGVISAPVLLLASPVMFILGISAAIAQTLFFPFQLFSSFVKDGTSPSTSGKPNQSGASSSDDLTYDNSCNGYDADNSAGKHFPPLFTTSPNYDESQQEELVPDSPSYSPS